MKPLPLRWKISAWSAAATGAVLLVFAAGILLGIYREQIEAVDTEIRDDASEARGVVASGRSLADLTGEPATQAFALTGADGKILQASRNFPAKLIREKVRPGKGRTSHHLHVSWRFITFPTSRGLLWVATNLVEVRESLFELLGACLFALPLAAALAAWGGWLVARRALLPVRRAALAAEQISGRALDRRLPAHPVQDEIGHLTDVINRMLDRIERSYRQAERFSADASHELRTPLTIMRGEIEALLRPPGQAGGMEAKLVSLLEEIDRLDRITEHLLLLAKFDAGRVAISNQPIDFSALVTEACEDIELLSAASSLGFTWEIAPGLHLCGEPLLLRRLALNLLENAVKHNQPGGWMRCVLRRSGDRIVLSITNTGATISPANREHIFERFSRAETSVRGHGLGLSLCREIAHAHSGTLSLAPDQPGGVTLFTAAFPMA